MNSKEKAYEIFNHFNDEVESTSSARRCAIYLVDNIIKELEQLHKLEYVSFIQNDIILDGYEKIEYWKNVKEILNTL